MEDIKYPAVDRSDFIPTFEKHYDDDQIDIGFAEGSFRDGRPFRAESWAANRVNYLTYYFSSQDIVNYSPDDLKKYMRSVHEIEFDDDNFRSAGFSGTNMMAKKIRR